MTDRRRGLLSGQRVRRRRAARRVGRDFASRVVANTERLLRLFDEHGVKATFFVLGWVAERFPALVARHRRARATRSRRTATAIGSSTTRRRDAFREDVRRAKALLEDRVRAARARLPRAELLDHDASRCGRSTCSIEEGYAYDASIFPIRHDRYGIPDAPRHPHVLTRAGGPLIEAPRVDRARGLDRICRSPAAATSGCCRTRGRAGASRASTSASASRRSSTCIRGRSIRISRGSRPSCAQPLPALSQPGQDGSAGCGACCGFPVRAARRVGRCRSTCRGELAAGRCESNPALLTVLDAAVVLAPSAAAERRRSSSSSSTPRRSSTGRRRFSRENVSVTAIAEVGRLQDVLAPYGLKPTYVIDYPVAADAVVGRAAGGVRAARASARSARICIPGCTPPFDEPLGAGDELRLQPGRRPRAREDRALQRRDRREPRRARRASTRPADTDSARRRRTLSRRSASTSTPASFRTWTFAARAGRPSRASTPRPGARSARARRLLELPCTTGFVGAARRMGEPLHRAASASLAAAAARRRHPGPDRRAEQGDAVARRQHARRDEGR